MTDHYKAAIDAVTEALAEQYNRNLTRDDSPYIPSDFNGMVEELVTAAEPHLRKKWAEEIREGVNPPDTEKDHEWRRGFITGVLRTARFLEGAGE